MIHSQTPTQISTVDSEPILLVLVSGSVSALLFRKAETLNDANTDIDGNKKNNDNSTS